MKRQEVFAATCCIVFLFLALAVVGQLKGEPLRIVSPPELSSLDGDDYGDAGVDIPFRAQHLYPADDFGALLGRSPSQRWLIGISARPDASVGAPISSSTTQFTLRLSTTEKTDLEMQFAANTGADETEVFNAALTFATSVSEPANEVPHAFDYVIPFQQPFNYDPSRGNLLSDFISTGFSSSFIADGRMTDHITDVINWGNMGSPSATDAYQWLQVTEFLFADPGDFNYDLSVDVADINLLSAEIRAGSNSSRFDLNDDQRVDLSDHEVWVHEERGTWLGDANLDSEFNSGDFVEIFTAGKYETEQTAGWSQGDWNADGLFNTDDMVTAFIDGGYELGPRQDVAPVPEPTSILLFMIGLIGVAACRCRPHS